MANRSNDKEEEQEDSSFFFYPTIIIDDAGSFDQIIQTRDLNIQKSKLIKVFYSKRYNFQLKKIENSTKSDIRKERGKAEKIQKAVKCHL